MHPYIQSKIDLFHSCSAFHKVRLCEAKFVSKFISMRCYAAEDQGPLTLFWVNVVSLLFAGHFDIFPKKK